jgi:hypothetical protein
MRKFLVIASLIAFSLPAMAQDKPTRVTPEALAWKENPAFPKGVHIANSGGRPGESRGCGCLTDQVPP